MVRFTRTTLLVLAFVAAPAAQGATAKPACPFLPGDVAARAIGKPLAQGKPSSYDTSHFTSCLYSARDKGGATLLTTEVYWQFARMTYDNYCRGAGVDTVADLGQGACMASDYINVMNGDTLLRVRIHLPDSPKRRAQLIDTARAILSRLPERF